MNLNTFLRFWHADQIDFVYRQFDQMPVKQHDVPICAPQPHRNSLIFQKVLAGWVVRLQIAHLIELTLCEAARTIVSARANCRDDC